MADASSFWDREIAEPQHISWLEHAAIHQYANELIGDGTPTWPIDWFEQWLRGRRFDIALSIGCGGGALERDLIGRGLVKSIDAFDGSIASLRIAKIAAANAGIADRIRYFAANFNEPTLPTRKYDLVLFHQSAHHVAKLEKLFRAVLRSLKPDGLLYLDEYVGPSRFEWSDELITPHRQIYGSLPSSVRIGQELPFPIQADDPSEAFRSSEIEPQLTVGFKIVARRPYGGSLLSVIYPNLRHDQLHTETIQMLLSQERTLLSTGMPSYYAVIVARPRRGIGRAYADAHYFAVPKFKRLLRELRQRLRTAMM
jgi:SAM-dependent methyltransferase